MWFGQWSGVLSRFFRTRLWLFVGLAALLLQACSDVQDPVSDYLLEVTPEVQLAGALRPGSARALVWQRAIVVDLRGPDEEGVAREEALHADHGLVHHSIPVQGPITQQQVEDLQAILAGRGDHPVVIHCRSGNRAAALWAGLRVSEGASPGVALSEVAPLLTSPKAKAGLQSFLDERDAS